MLKTYVRELAELEDAPRASADEPSQEEPDYPLLKAYWRNERRIAFLINFGERPVGFALVNDWSASGLSGRLGDRRVLHRARVPAARRRAARRHPDLRKLAGIMGSSSS
jgi:predicted acetyltransferase